MSWVVQHRKKRRKQKTPQTGGVAARAPSISDVSEAVERVAGPVGFASGGLPPSSVLDSSACSAAKNVPGCEVSSVSSSIMSSNQEQPSREPSSISAEEARLQSFAEPSHEMSVTLDTPSPPSPARDNDCSQEEKTEELPFHE